MFTQDRIEELLELYRTSDNYKSFTQDPYNGRSLLKRDLVEAKMQVDRWGATITDWIFHPSQKSSIESIFSEEFTVKSEKSELQEVKNALRIILKYSNSISLNKNIDDLTEEDLLNITKNGKQGFHIWGANVHYSEFIDFNKAMGLSLNPNSGSLMSNDSDKITNSIIVFKVS
jgi:hypothetical protein